MRHVTGVAIAREDAIVLAAAGSTIKYGVEVISLSPAPVV
jgi:hypothetical protein